MQMYVPMYLSNECQNICTYCGFSLDNQVKRVTLTDTQILQEAEHIKKMGYEHVLLVTGEANRTVGVPYLAHAIDLLRPHFAHISIEVQPLEEDEYKLLINKGLHTVLGVSRNLSRRKLQKTSSKGQKNPIIIIV